MSRIVFAAQNLSPKHLKDIAHELRPTPLPEKILSRKTWINRLINNTHNNSKYLCINFKLKKRIYRQGTGRFKRNLFFFYWSTESATTEEIRDLYNELDIMTNVGYHPNLVNLLGACTQDGLYHLFTLQLNSLTFSPDYLCTLFFKWRKFKMTAVSRYCSCGIVT